MTNNKRSPKRNILCSIRKTSWILYHILMSMTPWIHTILQNSARGRNHIHLLVMQGNWHSILSKIFLVLRYLIHSIYIKATGRNRSRGGALQRGSQSRNSSRYQRRTEILAEWRKSKGKSAVITAGSGGDPKGDGLIQVESQDVVGEDTVTAGTVS